ncbi:outer membrane beta-barrel protein [Devosia sp.]|uniref:outer membrane beta-barrel protein n=1 Tax=Devosia sp. TaxID=1871048 RepID=UPI0026381F93|nr:outer membrane beta-barrel protein [Devosia sp.]
MPLRSFRHIGQIGAASALCALVMGGQSLAQSPLGNGDGSNTDNQRLLPGVYPAAPMDPLPVDFPGLREPYDPFFNIDWSVALRGAYTKTNDGEQFDVVLAPSASFEHTGSRSQIKFDASAEVDQPVDGRIDVSALRLDLSTSYALDSATTLDANADLSISRDRPDTPGLANGITQAPQTIVGSVDGGVTRQFGRFNVGVTGEVTRSLYGNTTYADGSVADNSEQDLWTVDGGLRLGFQATPIFEIFTQANLGREMFDHPSSVLLLKPDATNSSIKAGVAGKWNEVLSAEASVGLGLRRFDAASLGEVKSHLYDARLVFSPDPTWRFTAGLTTTVAPPGPDNGGLTKVEYAANADVNYTVNSWLELRALAAWNTSTFDGSSDTETGYGYGVGADYSVNAHTALTADYGYEHADKTNDSPEDSHRVTVGVTVKR